MTLTEFFIFVAFTVGVFCMLDKALSLLWPNEDQKVMDEWQKIRKTLEAHGGNVPEEFSNELDARIGARSAEGHRQTRTLRGDITRLWERCRQITKTRY